MVRMVGPFDQENRVVKGTYLIAHLCLYTVSYIYPKTEDEKLLHLTKLMPTQWRTIARKHQRKGKDKAPHQTKFVPACKAQIQKLKEAKSIGCHRKLELPAAQVGEAELEDIVKISHVGEHAKLLVAGGGNASGRLLSNYEGLE